MSSSTHITPNFFYTKVGASEDGEPIIVYFIPGNPGLVSYYHYFLSLLASNLSSDPSTDDSVPLASGQTQTRSDVGAENTAKSSGSNLGNKQDSGSNLNVRNTVRGRGIENEDGCTDDDTCNLDRGSMSSRKHELWKYPNTNVEESFYITGRSLAGFDIEETPSDNSSYLPTFFPKDTLHDLASQVEYVENNISNFVRQCQGEATATPAATGKGVEQASGLSRPRPKVILIGHSVGAYIAMEIMRKRREMELKAGKSEASHSNDNHGGNGMDVIGAVMLFPAIVDIAKSPSGQKAVALKYIPYLDTLARLLVKSITSIAPDPFLRGLVRYFMRNPPEDALNTTIAFLKSGIGVQQALHLGSDEMEQIGPDKWSDEIWGISEGEDVKSQLTKLIFYFGRGDHWVADKTRDEIIKTRSSNGVQGPKMHVCEDNIEHGFCIRHNEIMADKVSCFIREIVNEYKTKR